MKSAHDGNLLSLSGKYFSNASLQYKDISIQNRARNIIKGRGVDP